ncbi:hypothetical protein KJ359_010463 [Pestalotiopsis sp. 9143b]|nr:hypothetical protein KJ359_010463 [Pestalotiopsis sp. 9143b]
MPFYSTGRSPTTNASKADVVILRQVLKWMCEGSEECYNQAVNHLIVPAAAGAKRKSDQDAQADASKKSKTVATSKFEKCVTCEKTFDVTRNRNEACQTHDDLLTVDLDCFPYDDEVQDGAIDPYTDWRRKIQRHFSAAEAEKARKEGIDLDDLAERYKEESETSTEDESEIESEPPSESEPSSDTELPIQISSDEDSCIKMNREVLSDH